MLLLSICDLLISFPVTLQYVACAGLPEPRSDHALAMGRFATECLTKLPTLLKKLEIELGPDTSDLSIRVGLHR